MRGRLADQHCIPQLYSARADEVFPRPGKAVHQTVLKLGDLFGSAAVDWLTPVIGDIVIGSRIKISLPSADH